MDIKVISDIRHLELNESTIAQIFNFTITKNGKLFESEFASPDFIFRIGTNQADGFLHRPFIYFIGNSNDIEFLNPTDSFEQILETLNDYFILIIHSLWFVKDNSVFISKTIMQVGNFLNSRLKAIFFSNSSGGFKDTIWNNDELLEAISYFFRILKIAGFDKEQINNRPIVTSDTTPSMLSEMPFTHKPIARAFHLLPIARGTSMLPFKISLYMSILETLFHSGKENTLNNIKNRIEKFLNEEEDASILTKRLIGKAYDIRSRFLHGDIVTARKEKLTGCSMAIDSLVRTILKKFLQEDFKNIICQSEKDYIIWLESLYKHSSMT